MEKVNIAFHDNGTVSFQHRKILRFVPEMSVDRNTKIVLPNIPLLVSSRKPDGAQWAWRQEPSRNSGHVSIPRVVK